MGARDDLLRTAEVLVARLEELDPAARDLAIELLDALEELHRAALRPLLGALDGVARARLRATDPGVAWLLDVYGEDEHAAAEQALASIRPYIASHGGTLELLGARDGVVRVRLAGACSGCTASELTLQGGVERTLRERLRGFRTLKVEPDDGAPAHPPPSTAAAPLAPDGMDAG